MMNLKSLNNYRHACLAVILILTGYFTVLVLVAGLNRPYWGDEAHFVKTIREFEENLSFDQMKHYNEMSTPLPFVVYAI